MTPAMPQVEYIGFNARDHVREYVLLVKRVGVEPCSFTLAIPTEAFLTHRVRYQDAPEICFLKLQRELAASADALPEAYVNVTDADMQQYREAHAARQPQRRPRPPQQGS